MYRSLSSLGCLLALAWVLIAAPNHADAVRLTNEERAWIAAHPTIRMGTESSWPPFDYLGPDGQPQGIAIDYAQAVAARLGLDIELVDEPTWGEKLGMLEHGGLDAMTSMRHTPQRDAYLLFTAPYFRSRYVIVTRKEDSVGTVADLAGKVVAIERDYALSEVLARQYPDIRQLLSRDSVATLEAVSTKRADAYIGHRPVASFIIERDRIPNLKMVPAMDLRTPDLRIGVRRDWPMLRALIDKALADVSDEERRTILRRWVPVNRVPSATSAPPLTLTPAEKKWLAAHPDIRLGVDPSWPPFESVGQDGEYQGIGADVVSILNQMLGISMRPHPAGSWSQVLDMTRRGGLDVLPTITPTLGRETYLNFTRPYLTFPYMIFVDRDVHFVDGLDDLDGKRVAVERRYAMAEILAEHHPGIELVEVETTRDALLTLGRDDADAHVGNLAATSWELERLGLRNVKIAAPTPYHFYQSIGVRKDWPELAHILDKAIAAIPKDQAQAIKNRWFAVHFEHEVDLSQLFLWVSGVTGTALVVIAGFLYWNRRLHREIRLRTSAEIETRQFRGALEQGPAMVAILSPDGRVDYANPRLRELTGLTDGEILGCDFRLLLSPRADGHQLAGLRRAVRRGRPWFGNLLHCSKEGPDFWSAVSVSPLFDEGGKLTHVVCIAEDVTERRAAAEALRRNRQQLHTILETIPIAVGVTLPDGSVLFANRHVTEMFELPAGISPLDLNLNDFYADPKARERTLETLGAGGAVHAVQTQFLTASGGVLDGLMSALPVDFDGRSAVLGMVVNISERVKMERAMARAKDAAEEASRFKSRFLANMSHEIRTPMNAILGFAHLARQTGLTGRQRDYLQKIESAGTSLLRIIDDILDFSRIEAGRLTIESVRFELEGVLRRLSDLISLKAGEKGIEILFDLDPQIPPVLEGDPLRIGQVLTNLTQNAVKFTERGEIVVRIEPQPSADAALARLRFEVRDTGIGIEPDRIARLFDGFTQADDSTTRRFGGTGLGLAICKQLVEMMGGEIGTESVPRVGSRFFFELQLPIGRDTQPRSPSPIPRLNGRCALVVDDNATARAILGDMLASFGLRTTRVGSGGDALRLLRDAASDPTREPFALALIDWAMPEMDGIETTRLIRRDPALADTTAILMVTAYNREGFAREAADARIDGFLVKPVCPSLLRSILAEGPDQAGGAGILQPAQSPQLRALRGRVLLVEDNAVNRQVAAEILRSMGLDTVPASSGEEALERLRSDDFDLIAMDIQMPGMDGFETTRRIRRMPGRRDLPIIALTAHTLSGDRERCLTAGMNEHIPKPMDPVQTHQILSRYLTPGPPTQAGPAASEERLGDATDLPIDLVWTTRRLGGNASLAARLIAQFAADHADAPAKVEAAIARGDTRTARRIAHTITGVAGNLGAGPLQLSSEALTAALRQGDPGDIQATLARLARAHTQTLAEISRLLAQDGSLRRTAVETTPSETAPSLQGYLELLERGDARAMHGFHEIRPVLAARLSADMVAEIEDLIENFEFRDAYYSLRRMLGAAVGTGD